jgi:hypothetical protein
VSCTGQSACESGVCCKAPTACMLQGVAVACPP